MKKEDRKKRLKQLEKVEPKTEADRVAIAYFKAGIL